MLAFAIPSTLHPDSYSGIFGALGGVCGISGVLGSSFLHPKVKSIKANATIKSVFFTICTLLKKIILFFCLSLYVPRYTLYADPISYTLFPIPVNIKSFFQVF